MPSLRLSQFTHTDMELMRLRLALTPGERIQAMLDAREILVGLIRGRLSQRYPHLSQHDLNLKVLKEIERAQRAKPWTEYLSGHSPKT